MDNSQTYSRVINNKEQDLQGLDFQTSKNCKSRLTQTESADLQKAERNNNKYNNTDLSNINPINSDIPENIKPRERLIDRYNKTIIQIKEQIDYDSLVNTNDAEIINNIVNVMADVMLLDIPYYEIEGNKISTDYVRLRYGQITYESLDAFLIEFSAIYYKINNPKAYLTTALYNIALTAGTALSNRVKNDIHRNTRACNGYKYLYCRRSK